MRPEFSKFADQLEPILVELLDSPTFSLSDLDDVPKKGVYVFYENDAPIYVGRTNRMRERLKEHGAKSSRGESATFALKLLRKKLDDPGRHHPKYPRKVIDSDPGLKEKFAAERERVRNMRVRVIKIESQELQHLFEAYAIICLGTTEYNSFKTT